MMMTMVLLVGVTTKPMTVMLIVLMAPVLTMMTWGDDNATDDAENEENDGRGGNGDSDDND
jgi:hypothetical protein